MTELNAANSGLHPAGPSWPCGFDCLHAQPQAGAEGDWIWCTRPEAERRLRHAGAECPYFRPAGSLTGSGERPPGFSRGN